MVLDDRVVTVQFEYKGVGVDCGYWTLLGSLPYLNHVSLLCSCTYLVFRWP